MIKVKEQTSCLALEPGAGAKYMHLYDSLPDEIRVYLSEHDDNICIACLTSRTCPRSCYSSDDEYVEALMDTIKTIESKIKSRDGTT